MSKARGLADLGNAFSDGALSNRNILINGNFDVWQRGDTSTTSNGYGSADRWRHYTAGVGGATFAKNSDGDMHITVTGSGSGTARVGQIIEFPEKYHGQTVTFTAKVKSNSTNARLLVDTNTQWYTETDTHSGGGDWETLSITLTLESSGLTYLRFTVGLDGAQSANVSLTSSDYVTIKECQLERGDTATPFEHRSYGDELQRCQRYYQTGGVVYFRAYQVAGAYAGQGFEFKNTMRATPTFAFGGDATWSTTNITGDPIVNPESGSGYLTYALWNASGDGRFQNTSTSYFTFDAEL